MVTCAAQALLIIIKHMTQETEFDFFADYNEYACEQSEASSQREKARQMVQQLGLEAVKIIWLR
jgi:hypothetical protein